MMGDGLKRAKHYAKMPHSLCRTPKCVCPCAACERKRSQIKGDE